MPQNIFRSLGWIETLTLNALEGGLFAPIRAGWHPRMLSYTFSSTLETTVEFRDGADAITGAMPVAEGGLLHASMNTLGHFGSPVSGVLIATLSNTAARLNGHATIEWIKKQETPGPEAFTIGFGLDPKVLGFWKFEESNGTRMATIGSLHLPVLSGSPDGVPGKHNQSMQLNLGDALELGFDPTLGLDAWTVAGWVRINDPSSDFIVLGNWHGPDQRSWGLFHSGNKFRAAYSTDGDVDIRRTTDNYVSGVLPVAPWVFVVARYNRVLGHVQVQATPAGEPLDPNPLDMTFGPPFNNAPNDCLSVGTELSPAATAEADFDSLGLFDFWLSDADVAWLYDNGAGIG